MRSMPCGREDCAKGSSQAAMRSVQSAYKPRARCEPSRSVAVIMLFIACPDAMRRAHASVDFMCAKSLGMVRVPFVPRAWHDMQPLDLTVLSQCAWVAMPGWMPLPLGPEPGNSLAAGILSIEYQ